MVKSTTNYSQFKTVSGNRFIKRPHLAQLTAAIARQNLLEKFPILVNEDMEVIDGQHRLEAAKKLKLEIFYDTIKGGSLDTVQRINTSTRSWVQEDFLESWVEMGLPDYIEAKNFMEYHSLPLGTTAKLLGWRKHNNSSLFREGKFKVNPNNKADIAADLVKVFKITNTGRIVYSHKFLGAIMVIIDHPKYDHARMMERVAVRQPHLWASDNMTDYIRQIEEVFNFDMKRDIRRFF